MNNEKLVTEFFEGMTAEDAKEQIEKQYPEAKRKQFATFDITVIRPTQTRVITVESCLEEGIKELAGSQIPAGKQQYGELGPHINQITLNINAENSEEACRSAIEAVKNDPQRYKDWVERLSMNTPEKPWKYETVCIEKGSNGIFGRGKKAPQYRVQFRYWRYTVWYLTGIPAQVKLTRSRKPEEIPTFQQFLQLPEVKQPLRENTGYMQALNWLIHRVGKPIQTIVCWGRDLSKGQPREIVLPEPKYSDTDLSIRWYFEQGAFLTFSLVNHGVVVIKITPSSLEISEGLQIVGDGAGSVQAASLTDVSEWRTFAFFDA